MSKQHEIKYYLLTSFHSHHRDEILEENREISHRKVIKEMFSGTGEVIIDGNY